MARGGDALSAASGPRVDVLFAFAYAPDVRVRRTTQALSDAGYRVRILAWDRSGTLPAEEQDGAVEIRRVHLASYDDRGWTQLWFLCRAVLRWIPALWRDPPDILHAVDLPMLLAAVLLAPATRHRPRIVYDAFEIYAVMESHKYPGWLLGLIDWLERRLPQVADLPMLLAAVLLAPATRHRPRIVYDAFEIYAVMESHKYPGWLLGLIDWLERRLPHVADLVITPGQGRQAYFAARGVASVLVANWVDPPAAPPTREAARAELGIAEDAVVILYAGGLDPSRDLEPLISHARRHPEHLVLIAGRGIQEGRLREIAATLPNLRVLGWLPNPDVALAAADMGYYSLRTDHPYAAHAAPNNLYTAIAYALPLVHRGQGEIGLVAARHRIGAAFDSDAELDAAIEALARPAVNAAVRDALRRLQRTYAWGRARDALLSAYPSPPRTSNRASP